MRASPAQLVRRLAELAPLPTSDPAPDAVLLERFIGQRDEAAFTVLVARHGPMVLRLCRRVLGNVHDADDAFQATFLVLARKAGAIRRRHHLAAWLHGAAYRLALKARVASAQRHRSEVSTPVMEPADLHPDPLTRMTARELLAALDEELTRLPEVYRQPLVLCCLEGRTQEEAAQQLGWTPGSVKGRLERGRARLHARLAQRGLNLSACLLALEALHGSAVSSVPSALLASTTRAGILFAAGVRTAGQGATHAVTLAEGVLKAMLLTKLKTVAALAVLVVVLGVGTRMFVFAHAGDGTNATAAKAPVSVAAQDEPKKDAPAAPKPGQNKAKDDRNLLQGTWVAVACEQDGRPVPAKQFKKWDLKLVIVDDWYIWLEKAPTKRPFNPFVGIFTLQPDRKPKQIFVRRPSARQTPAGPRWGVSSHGIYEVDARTLKLCLVEAGRPLPKDFTTQHNPERTLYVFRRSADDEPKKGTRGAPKPGKEKAENDRDRLQGTWDSVSTESNGKAIPLANFPLTIEGNRFTMGDRGLNWGNPLHGTFTLDPEKQPKAIDLVQDWGIPGQRPQRVPAIYELNGGTLKICSADPGHKRPTDFTTKPGSGRVLMVYRRRPDKLEKECFSTRKGNTITLHPENATFRVYDQMLNWYARFKNNFHLTRAELAKVENATGDWDTEYALVCNAVLPFARCYAHVGDEGWGKDGVGYLDLQARVYVLKKTLAQVKRSIEERGAAKVKEITKKPPAVTTSDAGGWKRWQLAYTRWYGDYGGTANVDFCARQFDGQTVVFVFMYTEVKRFPQEAKIRAMLESFTWPGKGNQKSGAKAAPAQPAFPSEKDSTAKLLKDLYQDDPVIRAAAIDLLARRKVIAAVPRLIDLLGDGRALIGSDNWVGGHAANALQTITGQRFYLDQNAWRRWWARRQADK